MIQADVTKIGLFCFYALLDGPLARKCALKAVAKYSQSLQSGQEESSPSKLVKATQSAFKSMRATPARSVPSLASSGLFIPQSLDLNQWLDLQKSATTEECHSLLWVHCVQIPVADVAKGLGLSPGTIQYRAARALKVLGERL